MAKYYDKEISFNTNWGGDDTTGNLPVSGNRVQEAIKKEVNSKVGYVGLYTEGGYYVLCKNEDVYNEWVKTVDEEHVFGDESLIVGHFDAPYNYSMKIVVLDPESGYKSSLVGSAGNSIRFYANTIDKDDAVIRESITVTIKVTNENGVSTQQKMIYDFDDISNTDGIVYDLTGKLSSGKNIITISAVGMTTNASTMRSVTYNYADIYLKDTFDITKSYSYDSYGDLTINVGYALKGIGKTTVFWYFDGQLVHSEQMLNEKPNLSGQNKPFYFNKTVNAWATAGKHTLQMYMECEDTNSKEVFRTPIYYREFIIEDPLNLLNSPFVLIKCEYEYKDKTSIITNGNIPLIYGGREFENVSLKYVAFYRGKGSCKVDTYITYNDDNPVLVSSENVALSNNFSSLLDKYIALNDKGRAMVSFKAYYSNSDESVDTNILLDIDKNDMKIQTVNDSVELYLNASGRTNQIGDKESWVYEYIENNKVKTIETIFSKNEYVMVSERNDVGEVMKPSDANNNNSLEVDALPLTKNEDYEYLIYNGDYYVWTREFDWSNTSGWYDNKLRIGKDNMITINFQPFSADMINKIKRNGATFEFEFETTNVYDDNAVICRICGTKNFAPGISIYASGAELVISREMVEAEYDEEGNQTNTNAGYIKAVSTKYKSEESNRISFVITPDIEGNREKLLLIYVNGECCGAYPYTNVNEFFNVSKISFRGTEKACVNISNLKLYSKRLSSDEILDNFIFYRLNVDERTAIYKRNDIVKDNSTDVFESTKLLSQIPVMTFYQIYENEGIDIIHQEKKNKKLPVHFDVVYIDVQDPTKNFVIKNAYITPQGTSSMNYPVKNFRLYTDKDKKSPATLYVGSNIFINGDTTDLRVENLNPNCIVPKKKYAMRDNSIPVKCWCLKADFAESSSSHNTGTARYWNEVLKSGGFTTKAQNKATRYKDEYKNEDGVPYDVRTTVDGFPIVLFYQDMKGSALRFEGKYNFNNDKSTEDVFGFTGGVELNNQAVKYYYIGTEQPTIHYEEDEKTGEIEWACSWSHGEYTETPTVDSPLYTSKYLEDGSEEWYMLRGKELLDNPKMECWELLNSVSNLALFKTVQGFALDEDEEKVGLESANGFDEAFESRYPDCGDYFHTNSLRRFAEWLVSCRYLKIDDATGKAIPFELNELPSENYYHNNEGLLSIQSLSRQDGTFKIDYPNYNFYKEVEYDSISSAIQSAGYQKYTLPSGLTEDQLDLVELETKPTEIYIDDAGHLYYFIKVNGVLYSWKESNLGEFDALPNEEETSYDFIKVGEKYFVWENEFNFSDYYDVQWVEDNAFNRALKFAVEKYDHIEMNKMAAYYIYLMRFGGVDQTVKNSMLTSEGPATDDPNSNLPSLWYFINYDNDTILGVKNDGRLVFDPYITRETKDGTGYVYAGRESTLWNNLEADTEFMDKVTEVDNALAKGEGNTRYALSYNNAVREYETNQSDKWCERIYNKDAERKYLDTYVKGWTQVTASTGEVKHVYEDYLYDVQGSRSAHRKWWLGRRFNIYDSKFCNSNFRSSFIKFRSSNLPAGSSFTIRSGEPIYYAWGHDNAVTDITPEAIQPNNEWTFTTRSTFNIGSYLEVMGAANMISFDLRNCVGDLTEINIENCYSPTIGTKLRELHIGDHTRTDLKNVSTTQMNFGGLGSAARLEYLDVTNIQNIFALDGLEQLINIRELYTRGTNVDNYQFANGAQIEHVEFSKSVKTISFIENSKITYKGLKFDDENYGQLLNLTIDHCPNLLTDPTMILDWLSKRSESQKANINLNLQGINWTLYGNDYTKLFALENVGSSDMGSASYGGRIKIETDLGESAVKLFKKIFGDNCFTDGAALYIEAPKTVYINTPDVLWEGTTNNRVDITLVGATLNDKIDVFATVKEGDKEHYVDVVDEITMDTTMLNEGYVTFDIIESNRNFSYLYITVSLTVGNGNVVQYPGNVAIKKRVYPETNGVTIVTAQDSYNNMIANEMTLDFVPDELDDLNFEGRGYFTAVWEMVTGTTNYESKLLLLGNGEKATIQAREGFDGRVTIGCKIFRDWDETQVAYGEKELEFTNPQTIITENRNKPVYDVLVAHGIIVPREDGYGFLTKTEAGRIGMDAFVDENGNSIFKGNKEITTFLEFEYFNSAKMGQMPMEGDDSVLTPVGMFEGCTNLKEIAFSQNFKYANDRMFSGCTNLEHIYGNERADGSGRAALQFNYVGTNFASGCNKLKECYIGEELTIIKNQAFYNCESLIEFHLPSREDFVIETNNISTPFQGCKNITFTGIEYPSTLKSAYQIIDGSAYKVETDKFTLIHMGKNSLMENIPSDKPVYACAYSMEYRTEGDVVVPENVVFDGQRIFRGSNGNSITLKCLVGNNCDYLFTNTDYGTNYVFANGETKIPNYCFDSIGSKFNEYTIPEGITTIGNNAFYGSGLKKIVFPSTLTTVGGSAFWLTSLKTIICNGATPPMISETDFFNVMLDEIIVKPEVYTTFKENIMHLISPFVRPSHLYSEGKIRIIKDGEFILDNETYTLTVGGINAELTTDEYFRYKSEDIHANTTIILTNNETGVEENLGVVYEQTMTIYIGDNSMLFSGDGYDFTKGVYVDAALEMELTENGWFYDRRFEGLRSNPSVKPSMMTFDVSNLVGENTNIIMGKYSQYDTASVLVKDGDGDKLIELNNYTTIKNGYNISNVIMVDNPELIFEHTYGSIKTGINGMVINKIGTKTYSDPEPQNVVFGNDGIGVFKTIYVNLISDAQIPNGIMVEVYDDEQRTYKKQYNGEPLTFIIPSNAEYTIKASAYISEKGKLFKDVYETITPDMSGLIDVMYNVEESVEYIGDENNLNTIILKSTDTDYYIDMNYKTSSWSTMRTNIDGINVDDITVSTADGFENTNLILTSEPNNSMFNDALNRWEDETIRGYIPSYEEMLFVGEKLGIKFDTTWVSETYDADFAWGSDGEKHDKSEVMKYYVFGRKISL